jgi:hypothetical protein
LAIEDLRVAHRDFARFPGVDGEDSGPDQSVAGKLDQGRVTFAAHDLLVNGACLARVHRLAAQLGIPLPQ